MIICCIIKVERCSKRGSVGQPSLAKEVLWHYKKNYKKSSMKYWNSCVKQNTNKPEKRRKKWKSCTKNITKSLVKKRGLCFARQSHSLHHSVLLMGKCHSVNSDFRRQKEDTKLEIKYKKLFDFFGFLLTILWQKYLEYVNYLHIF